MSGPNIMYTTTSSLYALVQYVNITSMCYEPCCFISTNSVCFIYLFWPFFFLNILPSNKSSKGIDDIKTCLNFKQKLECTKFAIVNTETNKGKLVISFPHLVPQHNSTIQTFFTTYGTKRSHSIGGPRA